jgi:hypothetical protein
MRCPNKRKKPLKKKKEPRAYKLLRRFQAIGAVPPLVPHFFYRRPLAPFFIGLEMSQIEEKIKDGELPPFVKATEGAKAMGWYGHQIITIQQERIKETEAA